MAVGTRHTHGVMYIHTVKTHMHKKINKFSIVTHEKTEAQAGLDICLDNGYLHVALWSQVSLS